MHGFSQWLTIDHQWLKKMKFTMKKIVGVVVVVLILGLVALYLVGRSIEDSRQNRQDLQRGRENAQDCLNQLDRLEQKNKVESSTQAESTAPVTVTSIKEGNLNESAESHELGIGQGSTGDDKQ